MLLIQTWIQTSRSFSTLWRSCDMQKFQVGCYETVKDRSISNALPSQSPKTQVIYGNLWIWVFHLFTPVQSSKKPRFWEPFTNCRSPLWTWQLQETSCSARKHCINQGLESLTLQTLQAQNVPKSETLCKFYANSILDFLDLAFTFLVSSLHRASSRLVGCCRAAVLEAFPNAARLPPGPLPREDQWHSAAGPGLKSKRNSFLRRQSWKDINQYPDNPKRNGAL